MADMTPAQEAEWERLAVKWHEICERNAAWLNAGAAERAPKEVRELLERAPCWLCVFGSATDVHEYSPRGLASFRKRVELTQGRSATLGLCDRHVGPGECIVFLAPAAVYRAGHVAWGYRTPERTSHLFEGQTRFWSGHPHPWHVGSVDNEKGSAVSPPGRTGYWQESDVEDPTAVVRPLEGYTLYKRLRLGRGHVIAAWLATYEVQKWPYSVFGSNCADAARHVAEAYGANLPTLKDPSTARPVDWFEAIPAPAKSI